MMLRALHFGPIAAAGPALSGSRPSLAHPWAAWDSPPKSPPWDDNNFQGREGAVLKSTQPYLRIRMPNTSSQQPPAYYLQVIWSDQKYWRSRRWPTPPEPCATDFAEVGCLDGAHHRVCGPPYSEKQRPYVRAMAIHLLEIIATGTTRHPT
jgi:hypothetical protein